jgi:hypothetical protein
MREVNVQYPAGAPADAVWEILSNFGAFLNWAGGGEGEIRIEGEGLGMIRHLDIAVGKIAERLVEIDPTSRSIGYSLVYGEPIGMKEYNALVQVVEVDAGNCELRWHGQFEPVDPEAEDEVAETLAAAFGGMTQALAAHVSQSD